MKIKYNIDSHSQRKPNAANTNQKLGNERDGLQSRFEKALENKKTARQKKPIIKNVEGQKKSPCHLQDKRKKDSLHSAPFRYDYTPSFKVKDRDIMLEKFDDSTLGQLDIQYPSLHLPAQGELMVQSMTNKASLTGPKERSKFINQLVEHITISTPHSSPGKEVRLLLNNGQLKGGEIHIKRDSQGYQVTIRQENALSVINQQAHQDLTERLSRVVLAYPIRLLVTEQHEHQHDQQHSRQQRTIYDEWHLEDNQ